MLTEQTTDQSIADADGADKAQTVDIDGASYGKCRRSKRLTEAQQTQTAQTADADGASHGRHKQNRQLTKA